MNKKLIKKLSKGTIAVVNDGTLEELREVLKCAFPNDNTKSFGSYKYYFKSDYNENNWVCDDKTDLPIHSVKEFLTQKQETMQKSELKVLNSIIKINGEIKEIKLEPKEGFEIDVENSDLKNGKVLFKEIKEEYPCEFHYSNKRHGKTIYAHLSEKYANKLSILDTLLCLRDEYNRIDGFTEGFRFGEDNWCITNYKNKLDFSCWNFPNGIMHFGKEETAKLFLKNFEEQLEIIKEFL